MKHFFTFLILFIFASNSRAQSGRIAGNVSDQSGKALQSVTISLLKSKDSSLVKAGATSKDGAF